MHSLGFYHEHARSDRDLYIKIVEKNVRPGIFLRFVLFLWHRFGVFLYSLSFIFNEKDIPTIQPSSIFSHRLIPRAGKFANFRTMRDGETSRNFDYDYNSIMHYGPYFFR